MDRPRLVRSVVALAALLAFAPRAPAAVPPPRPDVQWTAWGRPLVVLGFTADGDFLAYTRQVEYYPLETIDDDSVKPWKLVFGVVREARTGREHPYLLELSDESGATIHRDELATLPGGGAWRTWLAEHPLTMTRGLVGPGGVHAAARGTLHGAALEPLQVRDGRYLVHLPEGHPVRADFSLVTPDGRVWPSIGVREGSDGIVGWAEPIWSPDGRRVAWWMEEDDGNEHGPTQYVVIAPIGRRVELVVSPDDESRAWNALDRLEAAGLAPVFVSRAAAHLDATVISAQEDLVEEARALAARLPGVVSVVPMTRPSEYDLSIAAGPALMAPPPAPRRGLGERGVGDEGRTLFGLGVALGGAALAWLAVLVLGRRRR